jgi:hypothetical protein
MPFSGDFNKLFVRQVRLCHSQMQAQVTENTKTPAVRRSGQPRGHDRDPATHPAEICCVGRADLI